jgi:hypothetical protein
MDGWIKKSGATSNRNRTPTRGPLSGSNVLPYVKSEEKNKAEKDRIKSYGHTFNRVVSEVCL